MTEGGGPKTHLGRPLESSRGLSRAELSTWLGLAVALFIGWVVMLPLVAPAPLTRPSILGLTGLVFSAITATAMIRVLPARRSVDDAASTATMSEVTTFAYSPAFCRLLRFGRIFWPLMLLVSVIGLLGGLGGSAQMFLAEFVVFAFFLLLNLYVLGRLVEEIRASSHGLDVRMASGRSISVRWDEISRLRVGRRRDRFRVDTASGIGFSVESSLPGYPQLLQLVEQRLPRRERAV